MEDKYSWEGIRLNGSATSRKQATPKRELVMQIRVVFSYLCSQASKDEVKMQANHNKIVHLIISGIHFIWVKNGIQMVFIGLHQSLKLDFTLLIGVMTWNLYDYPLLQQSKGIIVMCMIISSLTSMRLVHIVHTS